MIIDLKSYLDCVPDIPWIFSLNDYRIAVHQDSFSVSVNRDYHPDADPIHLHFISCTDQGCNPSQTYTLVGLPTKSRMEYGVKSLANRLSWAELIYFLNLTYGAGINLCPTEVVDQCCTELKTCKFMSMIFIDLDDFKRAMYILSDQASSSSFTGKLTKFIKDYQSLPE